MSEKDKDVRPATAEQEKKPAPEQGATIEHQCGVDLPADPAEAMGHPHGKRFSLDEAPYQ